MTQASLQHPFIHGEFAPVVAEETRFDLSIEGALPIELSGRYLRNGPNPIGAVDEQRHHWFLGHGMVHGVRLNDGRAEWYRNRYVRSADVSDLLGESHIPNPWASNHVTASANTNVISFAGKTLALIEAGFPPIELSEELETLSISNLGGTLDGSFSAHPKLDPITGELHVMTYHWERGNSAQYVVIGRDGRVRKTLDIPLPGGPMIHDTAITDRFVVVFDLPCVFNLDAAVEGSRFPYLWDANYKARVGLLPRDGDASEIKWCEVPSCYVFHPMNAYDRADGSVVLDVVRHPSMFDVERRGPSEGDSVLERWVLSPETGNCAFERLDDRVIEFPRVNESRVGAENRYGYASALKDQFHQGGILKYDLLNRTSEVRDEGDGFGFGEAVFVAREGATAEDDGWLMGFRLNKAEGNSDLVVLNAQDIAGDPVAVVHLPARVPAGFHGNWCPDL
ncbi:lignostilbene-alpha,beta-dioxygenase-like enzyme [Actinobacteria bacterium IMCC26256]|nr:lignostilbene-alpha,beta-dioxygenase-like enzyme [Actinobacteria bacterium IMCC26256]